MESGGQENTQKNPVADKNSKVENKKGSNIDVSKGSKVEKKWFILMLWIN